MAGMIEGITFALANALNSFNGMRSTKVLLAGSAGDLHILLETADGWPAAGTVVIKGQTYAYASRSGATLFNLSYTEGSSSFPGLKEDVAVGEEVLDFSRTFSFLDQIWSSIFVNLATGAQLDIIGRNLGVFRQPAIVDDDIFREIIKATSRAPRGTMYALELGLTALLGAGNFSIREDTFGSPNTVFIDVDDLVAFADTSYGATYLGTNDILPYDDVTNEVTLTETPVGIVGSVRLADENSYEVLDAAKPSALTEIRYDGDAGIARYTYEGTNEGTAVTVSGGVNVFDGTAADDPRYVHQCRLNPDSIGTFGARFELDASMDGSFPLLDGRCWALEVHDQERAIRVGCTQLSATKWTPVFINGSGTPISATAFNVRELDFDTLYDIELRKCGEDVSFLVDGVLFQQAKVSDFPASTEHALRFGVLDGSFSLVRVFSVGYDFRTWTDYANERGTAAEVATATPTNLDTTAGNLLVGDVGKGLRTFDSATTNPEGGTNDGNWLVEAIVDANNATLTGPTRESAIVVSSKPTQVQTVADFAFEYPRDQGHTLQILGSGANAGEWTVAHILDPITGYPFSGTGVDKSDTALIVGAAVGTSGTNGAVSSVTQNRFVDTVASAFTAGDVGRCILVRDATNPENIGVFTITAFISADEVEVNSVTIGQPFITESSITWELRVGVGFVTESGLSWRLKPNFVTEVGLSYALTDAADVTGSTVTLRSDPAGFNFASIELIMQVTYTMVLSAHTLTDDQTPNELIPATNPLEFTQYPFYLPTDTLASVKTLMEDLTAAGVIPEVE